MSLGFGSGRRGYELQKTSVGREEKILLDIMIDEQRVVGLSL